MKQKRNQKTNKYRKYTNSKLRCIIIIIILMPIYWGIYLHCQETKRPHVNSNTLKESKSLQISSYKNLDIPVSMIAREEQIIRHVGYSVSYNQSQKIPNWVSYEHTRQKAQGNEKRNNRFIADPLVKGNIATNADYARSGYDKGHMAPAADMKWSSLVMKESFYFSNVCPQDPQLNRRAWKNLEERIRHWADKDSAVIIICGPIVTKGAKTIGPNKVTVPDSFFKVILSPFAKPIRAIGFLFHNGQAIDSLSTYVTTVDKIENLVGMDFFATLPDNIEKSVEKESDLSKWPN